MAVERGFGKLRRAGVLGLLLLAAGPNGAARAFSDPAAYADLAINGGGAGRWFTGSSADGYGCDVCHEGAPGVDLAVVGLPADGVVPGTPYEVTLTWPLSVEHVALIAEFTDELRQGAGTLALPQPEVTPVFERCTGEEEGFPASALLQAADGLTPCESTPPAASAAPATPATPTPTPRCVISVVDCGARMLRFQWTAPAVIPGRLWFNAGFIVTNDDAKPGGDGVTLVSMPLAAAGTSLAERTVAQGCAIAAPAGRPSALAAALALVLATLALRRRATSRRHAPRAGRRRA